MASQTTSTSKCLLDLNSLVVPRMMQGPGDGQDRASYEVTHDIASRQLQPVVLGANPEA